MQKEGLFLGIFILVFFLSALACTQRSDYLPVADGMRWDYAIELDLENNVRKQKKLTIRYDGEEIINGKKYFKRYSSSDGASENLGGYDRKAEEGLFTVPASDKDKPEFLDVPLLLKVGETQTFNWNVGQLPYTREMTLLGMETLSLSGKTYKNCLKFSQKLWYEKDAAKVVVMNFIVYYAPNIGKVKKVDTVGDKTMMTSNLINYEPAHERKNEKNESFFALNRVFNLFRSKSSSIVGKWVAVETEEWEKERSYEFLSDKTGIYTHPYYPSGDTDKDSFLWNILDDGRIKIADRFGNFCMGSLENRELTFEKGECWADSKHVYVKAK